MSSDMAGPTDKGTWFEAHFGLTRLRFHLAADGRMEWPRNGFGRRPLETTAVEVSDKVYDATLEGEGQAMQVHLDLKEGTLVLRQDLESGECLRLRAKVREVPGRWAVPF